MSTTGSPSSKYEHRRASALLHNIQNIRICMGKKNRFCNLRKWKDFNKKQLTLLKMCVTSLLCGPRVDLWPFYGFLCKRFSLYINVYRGSVMLKRRPCRLQTADCADRADCSDWVLFFLLVPQFSSKILTIVSCFPSLCTLCITIICCTDVYLQGSLVGNEKITGSCLPADVKAVSCAFSCAAFTQERAQWRKVSCFFL